MAIVAAIIIIMMVALMQEMLVVMQVGEMEEVAIEKYLDIFKLYIFIFNTKIIFFL